MGFSTRPVYIYSMEQWKAVAGYEGLYEVSNFGRVKSLGNDKKKKEKILSPGVNSREYLKIGLRKDRTRVTHSIHRLVAAAFIDNPDGKRTVNHKDGNKKNNNVTNLEWATDSENVKHSYASLGRASGERHGGANAEIRRLYAVGNISHRELGEMFGISKTQIGYILSNKQWRISQDQIDGNNTKGYK